MGEEQFDWRIRVRVQLFTSTYYRSIVKDEPKVIIENATGVSTLIISMFQIYLGKDKYSLTYHTSIVHQNCCQ